MDESLAYPTSLAVGKDKANDKTRLIPWSRQVRQNKANDKKSADAVAAHNQKKFPDGDTKIPNADLMLQELLQELTDLEMKIADEDTVILSKILADLEIKISEAEKNTEKLIALSKSLAEQNRRLRQLRQVRNRLHQLRQVRNRLRRLQYRVADLSDASFTRSETLGMVTALGFAGLVAGILVGLFSDQRR